MRAFLEWAEALFDALHAGWKDLQARRTLGSALVVTFVGALAVIELNRQGLVPPPLDGILPTNHFSAVALAFTLLLIIEVLSLVWTLADSVANSVGKQFELLALILLRKAFLEFGNFGEPIVWSEVSDSLLHLLADATGALLIFVVVGFYYRVQRHHAITSGSREERSFVASKKVVGLALLAAFVLMGVLHVGRELAGRETFPFFEAFYLVLIFADILIVLLSLRYSYSFRVVFRNSGFAISTVVIRLALTAPPYVNALLGVGAALFALGISLAYNAFAPIMTDDERAEAGTGGGAGEATFPGLTGDGPAAGGGPGEGERSGPYG
ncbi:MAG: hypothetical protein ACOC83_05285 [Gemmatimonadota bacterium]